MTKTNNHKNRLGFGTLVTILSMAGLYGCQPGGGTVECGDCTRLNEFGVCVPDFSTNPELCGGGNMCVDTVCQPGTVLDPASCTCNQFDPCANVNCGDAPLGPGVAEMTPQASGTACVCVATRCDANFDLQGAGCVPVINCDAGFIQEGGVCIPQEDVSCYDVPQSPLCIPTRCDEQPTAADGTDLAAAGKCVEAPPVPPESCTNNCHNGIEDPHPWFGGPDLTCTGCHGGNGTATTRETAHVAIPTEWQTNSPQFGRPNLRYYWNYNTLFGVENFEGGLEWLRFRQPSDLRVADQSCGKNSGCHQDRVENTRRGVMATAVGLVGVAQARNGIARSVIRGDDALYKWDTTEAMTLGWGQLETETYNPDMIGSVRRLTKFEIRNRENFGAYDQIDLLKEIYDKQCGDCHLGNAGANNRYADFRTSGCGSCHMAYALDGRSRSADQMIRKDEPTYPSAYAAIANFNQNDLQNLNGDWLGPERSHPQYHRLTKQMSSQRCGTCHVGSNRTDWQFRGYQIDPNVTVQTAFDNGFLDANQFQFTDEIDNDANPFARYHGQAQNQVLKFVDWDNDGLDDIPADIHFQAGMECMDCHTSAEMHNELKYVKVKQVEDWQDVSQVVDMSGSIWSHMDQSTEVECVHCHGNLEYRALPYEADNRNPVRNMIACGELGETIEDYEQPAECQQLGRGRWMKSKFTDRWHYVPQTYDTVNDNGTGAGGGGATRPNGQNIYTLNASIFHGRFNDVLTDGAGPCPNGNINNCFKDQANNQFPVEQNFSHLGRRADNAVDQHQGGLECYACHATWANQCFGCHLRLADNDGNNLLRDFARSTGEYTLGFVAEADFTYIAPLDLQYGINAEGKIAQFLPETKQMFAHTDYQNNQYFGTQVIVNNDANIQYNVYRDRAGYGLRQYNTELVGLPPNADGRIFEQFAEMDNNAGQGAQAMMPHSVQRSHPRMDCQNCHIDANQNNTDAILARWMANPNGFANQSAYLDVLTNTGIVRNNSNETVVVDVNVGYRFDANTDPNGFSVDQQSDWCVEIATGFPYCYNNHPMRETTEGIEFDPEYARAYPTISHISGPLNVRLMTKMFQQIFVNNEGVQLRGRR